MTEIKSYLVKNECYLSNRKMSSIRGVLIHSTATPGAMPENFARSWNTGRPNGRQVCVHAFCDDTKVINTLPYNMRCWGCGGSGNNYYIQIEICEPKGIYFANGWQYRIKDGSEQYVKEYIAKAVDVAAEWAANRLLELGIHEVNKTTVTSHYEAHAMGMASGHSDPNGLLGLAGLSMDDMRNKIRDIINHRLNKDSTVDNKDTAVDNKDGAVDNKLAVGDSVKFIAGAVQYDGRPINKNYVNKVYKIKSINRNNNRVVLTIGGIVIYAVDLKYLVRDDNSGNSAKPVPAFTAYRVRINCDCLNIRKGPGITYPVVSSITGGGVYTIVEVDSTNKWGKLKSGIGWISLGYTSKI